MFTRLTTHSTTVIGSLETEHGGSVYYGYDTERGLLWLNRADRKYSSNDEIWHEASTYIRASLSNTPSITKTADEEIYTVIDLDNYDNYENEVDTRTQEDILRDFEDDDLSARANNFLELEDINNVF